MLFSCAGLAVSFIRYKKSFQSEGSAVVSEVPVLFGVSDKEIDEIAQLVFDAFTMMASSIRDSRIFECLAAHLYLPLLESCRRDKDLPNRVGGNNFNIARWKIANRKALKLALSVLCDACKGTQEGAIVWKWDLPFKLRYVELLDNAISDADPRALALHHCSGFVYHTIEMLWTFDEIVMASFTSALDDKLPFDTQADLIDKISQALHKSCTFEKVAPESTLSFEEQQDEAFRDLRESVASWVESVPTLGATNVTMRQLFDLSAAHIHRRLVDKHLKTLFTASKVSQQTVDEGGSTGNVDVNPTVTEDCARTELELDPATGNLEQDTSAIPTSSNPPRGSSPASFEQAQPPSRGSPVSVAIAQPPPGGPPASVEQAQPQTGGPPASVAPVPVSAASMSTASQTGAAMVPSSATSAHDQSIMQKQLDALHEVTVLLREHLQVMKDVKNSVDGISNKMEKLQKIVDGL